MYTVYVLRSSKDGNLYIGCTFNLKKRIENHNKLITNSQGQDIRTHIFIMMATDEIINEGDRYRILTKNGVPFRDQNKTYQVKVLFDNAGFLQGNIEVAS